MDAIQDTIKRLFGKLTPVQRAATELAEAEHRLLEAQSAVEYAQAIVVYNQARIKRLRSFLSSQNEVSGLRNKGDASA